MKIEKERYVWFWNDSVCICWRREIRKDDMFASEAER